MDYKVKKTSETFQKYKLREGKKTGANIWTGLTRMSRNAHIDTLCEHLAELHVCRQG